MVFVRDLFTPFERLGTYARLVTQMLFSDSFPWFAIFFCYQARVTLTSVLLRTVATPSIPAASHYSISIGTPHSCSAPRI